MNTQIQNTVLEGDERYSVRGRVDTAGAGIDAGPERPGIWAESHGVRE